MKTNLSSCCNAEVKIEEEKKTSDYTIYSVCTACGKKSDLAFLEATLNNHWNDFNASPEVIEKSNTVYGKNSIIIGECLIEKEDNMLNIGGVRFKMTDEDKEIIERTMKEVFSTQEKNLREKIAIEVSEYIGGAMTEFDVEL